MTQTQHRRNPVLYYLFFLSQLTAFLLATPLNQALKLSPPRHVISFPDIERQSSNHSTTQSNRTTKNNHFPPSTALTLPPDIRILHYTVPETNVDLEFILFLRDPVDPPAFKQAIWQGVAAVRDHIIDHGDGWLLLGRDDPYYSTVFGKCVVKIESQKREGGRSSLTYKTLLAAFVGMWNRLYVEGEEWEVSFRIQVAGLVAGHGTIRVPESLGSGGRSRE